MPTAVEMRGITKRFPGILANDRVNLSVEKGEIHALVGENGAGKTTLMNILYGLYQPDEGDMLLHGQKAELKSPRDAIQHRVGMVHQHFMLVEPLTIVENIVLGSEPTKGLWIDLKKAHEQVKALSDAYGLKVDPSARVEDTVVGMQQRTEILKLLYRGADILIFDEPTAVLTPQETEELFKILRKLAADGKTILFITHKLKEIKAVTNRITIMRLGKVVGHLVTADTNEAEIASEMVGREVNLRVEKAAAKTGDVVLQVKDLESLSDRNLPALRKLSLEVRAGEILGIAGVAGNGQSELAEALTGLRPTRGGQIVLKGQDITHLTTAGRLQAGMAHVVGIAHIPEDRHKRGLVLDYSVALNLILGNQRKAPFAKGLVLDFPAIADNAKVMIQGFDIRTPSADTPSRALSGGNQQKIIIAREFSRDPTLLVVVQPTRGVDVGAIEFIHKRLVEKRDQGKAILLISMELEEVIALSDRIAVLYEGEIVGLVDAAKTTEQELGLLMAGGKVPGMNKKLVNEILTSVVALILALVLAGLTVLLAGRSPIAAVSALLHGAFGSPENIADTINRTTPLILTGLAVSFAFRSGLFNIGGEGQYLMGGMGAVAAAIGFSNLTPFLLVPLTLVCGALAGAAWGGLAAWFKSRFGVHEVISTIMLNWCAFYLVAFLVNGTSLKDPSGEGTFKVPLTAVVPRLIGTHIFTGIFVALALAAVIWFILKRTWLGYEIGAAGYSPLAAEYGGISVPRTMIVAMAVSGALAALAGAVDYGISGRIPSTLSFLGKGFDGIAVALIGKNEPVGVVIAAFIFGALSAGNTELQVSAHVPKDVTTIIQGLIILFMVAPDVIRQFLPFLRYKEEKTA